MKIHVNKNYFSREKTGKGKFAARLVKAWKEMGIEITEDQYAKADIALHIGRINYSSNARKHVLRVGPANVDLNMNWKKINHEKAQSVKKADAIVYQSHYSKKIYHKLVCHPDKPETIILNGADPRDEVATAADFIHTCDYYFLASTRVWIKQKRLKQIIKAFLEADIPKSHLIICGDTQGENKKYGNMNKLSFLGNVHQRFLNRLYQECTTIIHLTYVDCAPNSVVEAQIMDCPVICTDQGGTHELIRNGIVLKDKPFKYAPIDLNKPPKVDRNILIEAMIKACEGKFDIKKDVSDLYIDNIARKYLKFFEELL